MNILIEKMSKKHLDLINLNEFDNFWNMNMLREEISSTSSFYIIAKNENDIVGFAGINIILDEAHIANIVVRKDMRKKRYWFKINGSIN